MNAGRAETRESGVTWPQLAVIFLCAAAVVLPLAWRGNSCGHDYDFHVQSWLAAARQWRQGTLYPHWFEAGNYGAGEPRFVFYPPLSWMLGALLGTVFGWSAAPAAFTLLVLAGCGVSMNRLARVWLPGNAATVAACAYILNPYALFVAYERTAYAELAAGIWLPLVLLYTITSSPGAEEKSVAFPAAADRTSANSQAPQLQYGHGGPLTAARGLNSTGIQAVSNIILLALCIAAIWLTNAPAAVMACYALAAIAVWGAISRRRWRPILDSALSLILGLGLSSFYILPAAYERRWVDIARAIGPGMRVEDSFLFGRTGEPFHDMVLHTASWIFVTMTVTSIAAICVIGRRNVAPRLRLPLLLAPAALLGLQLHWSAFLWRVAPELKFLQFPWRWSLLLSIVFALSLGAVAASLPSSRSARNFRLHAAAILIAAIAAGSIGSRHFRQPCDEEDAVSAQVAVFRSGSGFEGTDEYTPLGADNSLIQQGLPAVRFLAAADAELAPDPASEDQDNPPYTASPATHVACETKHIFWHSERKYLEIDCPAAAYSVLRLLDYPAWQVKLDGVLLPVHTRRDDGLVTVPIGTGHHRVEVAYIGTPDLWLARALSIASVLAILGLIRTARTGVRVG